MITFWLSILLAFFTPPKTEKLEYDIFFRDKDIGDYSVVRTSESGIVKYKSESLTRVHLMGTVEVKVVQHAHYVGGVLTYSEASTSVNGHNHDHVVLQRTGNRYEITKGEKTYQMGEEIKYSIIKLMYEEPHELGRVFSEMEGAFHRIEKQRSKQYMKTNSRGQKNYYTFDQNSMKIADVDSGVYRFKMRRRD